jgi:hypothetical protein
MVDFRIKKQMLKAKTDNVERDNTFSKESEGLCGAGLPDYSCCMIPKLEKCTK